MSRKRIVGLICVTVLFLAALGVLLWWDQTQAEPEPYRTTDFAMSTFVTQELYGENAQAAAQAVSEYLFTFEAQFSPFVSGSAIDRINQNAGVRPVLLEEDAYALLKQALEMSQQLPEYFDMTIWPVSSLWDVTSENPRVPEQSEIDAALSLVDIQSVVLNDQEHSIFLPRKGQGIDPGGILKGALVDQIWEILKQQQITQGVVSVGGNLLVLGTYPNGKAITVSLQDPLSQGYIGSLPLCDQIVATTSTYERYFEINGVRYHHVLDPQTGYPVQNDLTSVTVIGQNGMQCDMLSTALFVMGYEKAAAYASEHSGEFSVILVDTSNTVWVSPSLYDNFALESQNYTLAPLS